MIYKTVIKIPTNVQVIITDSFILLKKEHHCIRIEKPSILNASIEKNQLTLTLLNTGEQFKNITKIKMFWGTFYSRLQSCIVGLSQEFKVILKLVGVGFKTTVEKDILQMHLGYSHIINLKIPQQVRVRCLKPTIIILKSVDKLVLTQFAATIKSFKNPEPYKGKGIRYKGEKIIIKEGKKK